MIWFCILISFVPYLAHPRLTCPQELYLYSPVHTPFLKPLHGGLPVVIVQSLGPHESALRVAFLTNTARAGPHPTMLKYSSL